MRTHVLIFGSVALAMTAITSGGSPLPPGMARADQPKQVAALFHESHHKRAEETRPAPQEERLTAQEAYHQKLVAYRTQLVEEQRERKMKELELELQREARRRAEEEAQKAEIEREREARVRRHQAIQVYHEWIHRQRLREHHCHQIQAVCPQTKPSTCPTQTP